MPCDGIRAEVTAGQLKSASSTSAKATGSRSMSAMVLVPSSRVIRNHSFRVADRSRQSRPSRIEPSEQMLSMMLIITPDLSRLKRMGKHDKEGNFQANRQK